MKAPFLIGIFILFESTGMRIDLGRGSIEKQAAVS